MIDLTNLNKLFSFSKDQQPQSKVEPCKEWDVKLDLTNFHKLCPHSKDKQHNEEGVKLDLTILDKLYSFSDQQPQNKVKPYKQEDVKLDLTNFHKLCSLSKGKQRKEKDEKLDLTNSYKLCSFSKSQQRKEKDEKKFKSFKAYNLKTYEKDEQKAIFKYARMRKELKWLFAIPNGGKRSILEAMSLKAQGLKPGVPDMFLPLARNGYHGLFIELKVGKNKTTPQQDEFIRDVSLNNYKCEVCYGAKEAIKLLEDYIQRKD